MIPSARSFAFAGTIAPPGEADWSAPPPWQPFAEAVTAQLAGSCLDDAVNIVVDGASPVQWAQSEQTIDVHVMDEPGCPLPDHLRRFLSGRGWAPPEQHVPLWRLAVPWCPAPALFRSVARSIVDVLHQLPGVTAPGDITSRALNLGTGDTLRLTGEAGGPTKEALEQAEYRQALIDVADSAALTAMQQRGLGPMQVVAVIAHPPTRTKGADLLTAYPIDQVALTTGGTRGLIVMSHVRHNQVPGSRFVPPHPRDGGPHVVAWQGEALYLRDLFQRNGRLARAVAANPGLHQDITGILHSGRRDAVQAMHVYASEPFGPVSAEPLLLDRVALDLDSIGLGAQVTAI